MIVFFFTIFQMNAQFLFTYRYGAKLVHDRKLTAGLLASFLMYMLQVALGFAFLASLFSGKFVLFSSSV